MAFVWLVGAGDYRIRLVPGGQLVILNPPGQLQYVAAPGTRVCNAQDPEATDALLQEALHPSQALAHLRSGKFGIVDVHHHAAGPIGDGGGRWLETWWRKRIQPPMVRE